MKKILAIKRVRTVPVFYFLFFYLVSCTKTDYDVIDNPAYIRVFNNFTYTVEVANKDQPQPFFCMFIDPEFDDTGKPIGGLAVGDFLDKRAQYASPNPSHMGTGTSKFNPEYPGRETVLTAPLLNGFDLTNWAQVNSGKRRFLFMSRPISDVPFAQLPDEQQRLVFLDTTIDLQEHEVYTIHLLQKDFKTKENGVYVRQENFYKQQFSDAHAYVNFYNLSAKGFWSASTAEKGLTTAQQSVALRHGIRDTMNIYMSHIKVDTNATNGSITNTLIPEFSYQFAGTLYRSTDKPVPAPYYAFPIFLQAGQQVYTGTWQYLQFLAPPLDPANSDRYTAPPNIPPALGTVVPGEYAYARFDTPNAPHNQHDILPNMLLQIHSGINNPQTFGGINTVEVVNGQIYLTTIQRRYPQPIY